MKKNQTYKFSQETIERLNRLSDSQGDSKAFILETALKEYELRNEGDRKKFNDLWRMLNDNIQSLELKRDYHPETGEDTKVLNWYNKIWDEFREQPFFSEIVPPELNKLVL